MLKIMHPSLLRSFLVIVIEGSRHSQMGQKVRFGPSTNSWGGKLHDDVSDLIHMLCTVVHKCPFKIKFLGLKCIMTFNYFVRP